ncbi:MAG: hypothetical protein COV36_02425 [Alphaproteobacteria bacterium CG11_big_fil_rev_8_21_14_0_20_44_7]|nr:MAG: hypothetical protein COV36_02425 [Alphaproteobacteria bacterium CG11_big_fil_rev_8_21_14_0_20_44_7]
MNLSRFKSDNSGMMAVEFALLLPVLLILFLGGFEVTRYVLLQQKISKTTSSMSDLISRLPSVSEAEISNSFNAVQHLMEPYFQNSDIKVIISSVFNNGGDVEIYWQRCGGGTLSAASQIGDVGDVPVLPNGFTLDDGEEAIIAEVFYSFTPVIAPDFIAVNSVYKVRVTKPRLGALITISDDGGVSGCS